MSEPFLGEIAIFGFNFAPRGWAMCNGQILPISQNTALFSLLGTTYGGNGQTTFALPDLRSRVPVHEGQGPGLSSYDLGQTGGSENVTLTTPQLPLHTHGFTVNASSAATSKSPAGNNPAAFGTVAYGSTADLQMGPDTTSPTGDSAPHNNVQPYLTLNFCIALEGIFPSRN
jgi:microcystin-dependent protein